MDASEQIKRFREFLEKNYKKELVEAVRKGDSFLVIDFSLLSQFDPDLAEELLEEPEEVLKAAELSLDYFDVKEGAKNFRIRLISLPKSQKILIRNIRSKHINKLFWMEGVVRQKSDVRPKVTSAQFECPSCGHIIRVLQLDSSFKEPSRCGCGRKGKFKLVSKELVDAQGLVLEEDPENLEGGEQPKRMNVFLQDDLVSPIGEKRTNPGSKIMVTGQVKEIPIITRMGTRSTHYDLIIEANNIEAVEEDFYEAKISQKEVKEILDLSKDSRVYEKLINSIAPSIFGYEEAKEAVLLQMVGGLQKTRADGVISKGDIHVLLVGDPGSGKSALLKRVNLIAPKGRYVTGKGVTGAGLTASVVKDEFLKGWSLEAGALVLASNGVCCLHEDTEIINDNKIIKIKDLFEENKKKIGRINGEIVELNDIFGTIQSFDKKKLKVRENISTKISRKKYKGELLNIKLESGFSIRLTPDHQVIDGDSLMWKPVYKFDMGNFIISPLKIIDSSRDVYLLDIMPDEWKVGLDKEEKSLLREMAKQKFNSLSEFNRHLNIDKNYFSGEKQFTVKKFKEVLFLLEGYEAWKKKPLKYIRNKKGERLKIDKITQEIGYLLGFIFGDGYVKITKRRTVITIYQSINNKEHIEKFLVCWEKVFRKKPGVYYRTSNGKIRSTVVMLYHGSNLLGHLYERYVGNSLSNILQLQDSVLRAFIAGAMDSDGCISIKHGIKSGIVYKTQHIDFLLSKDERTNLNFILALRKLDCYGRLINLNDKISAIRITGRKDVITLKKAIENYSVKMAAAKILTKISDISSTSDKLPSKIVADICNRVSGLNKSFLLKKGIWSSVYEFKKMRRRPSRNQLSKIMERCGPLLDKGTTSKIATLLGRDFFLDKIIKIEKENYNGYVYDLFVPEHHNFVANGIIVHNCIDELDKMGQDDRSAMHEALEQQTVSISKANIQATLVARTTVLAAANPKFGRFDHYAVLASQIDLPPTLINRFDLIFPVKDLPEKSADEKMASHILSLHQKPNIKEPEVPTKLLKKYISYARQNMRPFLSDEAISEIKNYYLKMRGQVSSEEGVTKIIPISPRQLEAAIRLAEASAKIRLSDTVLKEDAQRAIRLLHYCLMQVGFDIETGKIDIDRISTGIPAKDRNKIVIVREMITELENRLGKAIPIDDVVRGATDRGLTEDDVETAIEKLKRSGDIFEPRHGFLSRV